LKHLGPSEVVMPWSTLMNPREALIWDINDGMSVDEAALRHGIDRSCAFKWRARYRESGVAGLEERSRRPETSPNAISQEIVDELVEAKRAHQLFGPAKVLDLLRERHNARLMADSTAAKILERHGLTKKYRKRHASPGRIEHAPYQVAGAGDTMTADFKGQIRMGNGELCYPLTIADPHSRFLLDIVALSSTHMTRVMAAFERVFREHGVPRQIVTDNGTPFCSTQSLGGLTQLSRRWIELGSLPVRIAPGRPDQNGSHERMHRSFKEWIELYPRKNLRAHQKSFDAFRAEFNHLRSHQGLGRKTPVTAYRKYRPYPNKSAIEYDSTMQVRLVNANGEIKWKGSPLFVSEVLAGANVGLLQIDEQLLTVHFGPVKLGYLDLARMCVVNRRPEPSKPKVPVP
jgi:putative transposase